MLLNELHAALLTFFFSGKGRRTLSYAKEKPKPSYRKKASSHWLL